MGLHSSTSQLNVSTFRGIRSVGINLSVNRWVVTRHKLDRKRHADQKGPG
jgi:hypothetical protein